MSERDAVWPSFITCVESLTFSWSDSCFFDVSSLSTFPVTCELLELDAVPPDEPREPDDVSLDPIDPLLLEPDEPVPREPDEPDESEGPVADEPDDPADPVPMELDEPELGDPLEPALLDWALAGSATSSPAIPTPATIPLRNFMIPLPSAAFEDGAEVPPRRVRALTVVLTRGSDVRGGAARASPVEEGRRGKNLSDRLAT